MALILLGLYIIGWVVAWRAIASLLASGLEDWEHGVMSYASVGVWAGLGASLWPLIVLVMALGVVTRAAIR